MAANTNFAAGLISLRSTSFGTFPQPLIVAGEREGQVATTNLTNSNATWSRPDDTRI